MCFRGDSLIDWCEIFVDKSKQLLGYLEASVLDVCTKLDLHLLIVRNYYYLFVIQMLISRHFGTCTFMIEHLVSPNWCTEI